MGPMNGFANSEALTDFSNLGGFNGVVMELLDEVQGIREGTGQRGGEYRRISSSDGGSMACCAVGTIDAVVDVRYSGAEWNQRVRRGAFNQPSRGIGLESA